MGWSWWASHRPSCGVTRHSRLQRAFGAEALPIATDRHAREQLARQAVADAAVACIRRAVDVDAVPLLRVADVLDRHVVVLAPEERHGVESLPASQHVQRRDLALALRQHPVLDSDALTGVRIG